MPKTIKHAHIYRFRDLVAVAMPGSMQTVYLTPAEAITLGKQLTLAARDVKAAPFVESQFATFEMAFPPEVMQPGRTYNHARKRKESTNA